MSRKSRADVRKVNPDPLYDSVLISKFINGIMQGGKRAVAEQIFYGALEEIKGKSDKEPVELFQSAIDNVKPALEVRSRRVGGATYQVPVEVRTTRQQTLAIRWLVAAARSRGERTMKAKLAAELLEASQNQGTAIKKKQDTHRMAEANKAFAHYRW